MRGAPRIDLSWPAVDLPGPNADGTGDADGYYAIYRSTTSNGEAGPPDAPDAVTPMYAGLASEQGDSGVITFHDTGLTPGTAYFYKIYAFETGYSPAASMEASAVTCGGNSHLLTVLVGNGDGGTCGGGGTYDADASIGSPPLAATPSYGYVFVKWSTQPDGSDTVTLPFTMPDADATLYAIFAPGQYTLTLSADPSGGGTQSGDGTKTFNDSCTAVATPNEGYCFVNWTDESGVVKSRKPSYTFNMPGRDYTLTANYAVAIFVEGFEGLNDGYLAMNDSGNHADNGDKGSGNPWWCGPLHNQSIGGTYTHTGSKSSWDRNVPGCIDYVNLGYRFNNGSPYTGDVSLDWWFYDRMGQTHTVGSNSQFSDDPVSLTYTADASRMPTDTDYSTTSSYIPDSAYGQVLSLGQAYIYDSTGGLATGVGADFHFYQARIKAGSQVGGAAASYGINGWFNTDCPRSVGWHHGRIEVGPEAEGTQRRSVLHRRHGYASAHRNHDSGQLQRA